MEPLVILIGVLGWAFFLFLFGYLGDQPGGLLRSAAWTFAVLVMLFVPWLSMGQTCNTVVANQTVAGNVTSFVHTTYCYENPSNIGTTFFKIITWIFRIFTVYIVLAFFAQLIDTVKAYKGGRR